jgi:hypothetical protein
MPKPRQITMMAPPTTASNYTADPPWHVADNAITAGNGPCIYKQTKCDLRGLRAGGAEGIEFGSVSLQEAHANGLGGNEEYMTIIDIITTVKPVENAIANWYDRPIIPGEGPGFIVAEGQAIDPEYPRLNPGQVVWGLWRQIAVNGSYRLGAEFPTQVFNSGFFGQGDVVVAPEVWWTRAVYQSPDNSGVASTAIIAAANLVVWGVAVDMTAPEEMTAMMRSVQR